MSESVEAYRALQDVDDGSWHVVELQTHRILAACDQRGRRNADRGGSGREQMPKLRGP